MATVKSIEINRKGGEKKSNNLELMNYITSQDICRFYRKEKAMKEMNRRDFVKTMTIGGTVLGIRRNCAP